MPGRCNVHISMTPFKNESRLLREVKVLLSENIVDRVVVIALWEEGLKKFEVFQDGLEVRRVHLKSRGLPKRLAFQCIKYFEFFFCCLHIFYRYRATVINCHALASLPIGWVAKWIAGAKLAYDAHELETERNGLAGIRKKLSKFIERSLIGSCDLVIVPGTMIKKWYEDQYSIANVISLRNIPEFEQFSSSNILRDELEIGEECRIFLYHGNLSAGRGIEVLLDCFSRLVDVNSVLVVMGYGDLETLVKQYENEFPGRVFFKAAVKPEQVVNIAASAEYGICLIEPICLSYKFCLPNKLFEYKAAGIPILASNLPEMAAVLKDWPCELIESLTAREVASAVSRISKKEGLPASYRNLGEDNWASESKKLKSAFQKYLLSSSKFATSR